MAKASIYLAIALAIAVAKPAAAVDAAFEPSLIRLAEVLGSLHYLRNLCGESGDTWRKEMETFLTTENPDAVRRSKLVASFNRGYRTFRTVYSNCTPAAVESIRRYVKEGETLTRGVATRYGN